MDEPNQFSEEIIQFEKKHHLGDNDIAFGTLISVEKIHAIKSEDVIPTDEELRAITDFIRNYH